MNACGADAMNLPTNTNKKKKKKKKKTSQIETKNHTFT